MTDPTPPAVPEDSILEGVKKSLGISPDEDHFDQDVIMHTNSALAVLQQLGVGPVEGLSIEDNSTVWPSVDPDKVLLGLIRQAVHFRVRLGFDPPATSFAIAAVEKQIEQLEWRIIARVEGRPVV